MINIIYLEETIMNRRGKIQSLLISHLLDEGKIELNLPDGMKVELGILREEGKTGKLEKKDNYCWAIVSQKDREISMDSYNLGLRFEENTGKMLFEDIQANEIGREMRIVDVV